MKSATILALLLFAGTFLSTKTVAQVRSNTLKRCATMDRLRLYEANNALLTRANAAKAERVMNGPDQSNFRLQGLVTIPVVVHIVLPNPFLVTDADVQAQIDRLNLDFAGQNADSTNAAGFYNVRGHSQIRFALARRTPAGRLTNGIERRFSTTGSDPNTNTDPVKRTALGGLDAWNSNEYLNLWIGMDGTGGGILGYADNIGPGNSPDDGVFINYQAFGSSACYTQSAYNRGRTATHEVGHYFGLYHIWGDDDSEGSDKLCSGDDFSQLPATTNCSLPIGLYNPSGLGNGAGDVGDTPNQGTFTTSCPSGTVLDGCSTGAPGKMYQNHMDYTQDACLTMFTQKQVARMEWVLDNCRPGLKTSTGGVVPSATTALDVAPLAPVSPGGFELAGCRPVYYPDTLSCPGSLTPKFRVVNNGLETVTSLTVGYSYDGGTAVTQTISVNIPHGGTAVVSFAPITVSTGAHTFRFFTTAPNGGTDLVNGNDSFTQNLTVLAAIAPPVTEEFETAQPLRNWAIDNPDYDFTWQRTTPGRDGSAGKLSIDNYHTDGTRNRDDLRSAAITVDPASAYVLTFDVAHKNHGDPKYADTLAVLVSTDCGQSYQRVYYKGGATLATAGSSSSSYDIPSDADWRTETVTLNGSLLASGRIMVVFRNISGYGNWVHLDNIHLAQLGARDLRLSGISSPGATACSGTISPTVSVENLGGETIMAFKVGYRIDNGPVVQQSFTQNIAPGATATVSLPPSPAGKGDHLLTVFSFDPTTLSGTGDSRASNDTLRRAFTVVTPVPLPLTEGFETAFPPAGWALINPNNNVSWTQQPPGRNSRYAAFFDNYNNDVTGQTDDIRTPFLTTQDADSITISFDLAHKFFPDTDGDEFSVLVSTDCANNFTTIYTKTGEELATAGSTTDDYTVPDASDWRRETIMIGAQNLGSNVVIAFRNTNGYGNNIFLDNISITGVYKRDVQLVSVLQPKTLVCTPAVTPSVIVRNRGSETVTSFSVVYRLNNGAAVTQAVSGLSLAKGSETTVTLPQATGLTPGSHTLHIALTDLVTTGGTGDLNSQNDTLSLVFSVPATVSATVVESFVANTFAPVGWSVLNPDGDITWQRFAGGNGGTGSAFVNTFSYPATGQKDDLVTPVISFGPVDSVKLTFDVAAATMDPGGTGQPADTLEVLVTKDCGNSFTTVYKKWGEGLQTADGTLPQFTEFYPASGSDWRRETADLTAFATQSPVLLFFRVTSNNGNNIFLDNIAISTKVLPAQLKQEGYLVYPAPFTNSFTVWHYQTPTALRYIRVMNAAGQTVWQKSYNGNAQRQEAVDLPGRSAGIYFVELGYTDGRKAVVQKVMKR